MFVMKCNGHLTFQSIIDCRGARIDARMPGATKKNKKEQKKEPKNKKAKKQGNVVKQGRSPIPADILVVI